MDIAKHVEKSMSKTLTPNTDCEVNSKQRSIINHKNIYQENLFLSIFLNLNIFHQNFLQHNYNYKKNYIEILSVE